MEEKRAFYNIACNPPLSLSLLNPSSFLPGWTILLPFLPSTNYYTMNCKYTSEVEMIPYNLLMKKSAAAERAFKLEKRSSSSS
jgi:hypothetical protein